MRLESLLCPRTHRQDLLEAKEIEKAEIKAEHVIGESNSSDAYDVCPQALQRTLHNCMEIPECPHTPACVTVNPHTVTRVCVHACTRALVRADLLRWRAQLLSMQCDHLMTRFQLVEREKVSWALVSCVCVPPFVLACFCLLCALVLLRVHTRVFASRLANRQACWQATHVYLQA